MRERRPHFRTSLSTRMCRRCGLRYQRKHGLCRSCITDVVTGISESLRVLQPVEPRKNHAIPLTGRPTVVIDGYLYEVSWRGEWAGAQARGLPMAAQRGDPHYHANPGPRRRV
jgi:hypothetical protein